MRCTCLKEISTELSTFERTLVRPVGVDGNCAIERGRSAAKAPIRLNRFMLWKIAEIVRLSV
jgi:hypothetical protein